MSLLSLNRLWRLVPRVLCVRNTRNLFIDNSERDILLLETDLPSKHPDYLRCIPKYAYDAQFSKEVFRIYEPEEKSHGVPMVRRYAMVLPLAIGPQVVPIPFIVDSGASQFIYLCSSAVQLL